MTVMIDADYLLKIIGDQLYGEMSAGDDDLYDHKTYDDGLEWCFELIRNVANNTQETISVASPKWISVNDRLPEVDEGYVLACSEFGSICFASFDADGNWHGEYQDVTYWMPLPEPPEVEEV